MPFGRVEQGGLVEPIPHHDISTGFDQEMDGFKVASPRRVNQSRSSVTVSRVNLRATFQQECNALAPPGLERRSCPRHRLEQGRQPVRASAIHISPLSHRRLHYQQIPLSRTL